MFLMIIYSEFLSVLNLNFVFLSLVDLGEENVTKLKMPDEIEADKRAAGGRETVEAAKMATTEMAENAGEHPIKVSTKNSSMEKETK
jgi:hypothetical protein